MTRLPGDEFIVDSFFDITYQIDFVGAPGGALDGLSGSTQSTIRMTACQDPNPIVRGTIIIVKDAQPNDGADFQFTGLGSFFLDDDDDPTLQNQIQVLNVPAGNYSVQETQQAGWVVREINCDDPDGETTVDVANRQANIDLDGTETVRCTFVNLPVGIFSNGFESGDFSRWSSIVP